MVSPSPSAECLRLDCQELKEWTELVLGVLEVEAMEGGKRDCIRGLPGATGRPAPTEQPPVSALADSAGSEPLLAGWLAMAPKDCCDGWKA